MQSVYAVSEASLQLDRMLYPTAVIDNAHRSYASRLQKLHGIRAAVVPTTLSLSSVYTFKRLTSSQRSARAWKSAVDRVPFGLWVKCGIAECGMRKVKCGIENAE